MQLEQAIQSRFINAITNPASIPEASKAHQVYQELVYLRFYEVFEKALPRFKAMISEALFEALIYKFLKIGAKSPTLWQSSGEFAAFVVESCELDMPFLEDLLSFEYLELEMYMQEYPRVQEHTFSLQNHYKLSDKVVLKSVTYPIHHPEFDANPSVFEAGEYQLLIFYDAKSQKVLCQEITPFVVEFLNSLDGESSLDAVVQKFAFAYEIEIEELVEALENILQSFAITAILELV